MGCVCVCVDILISISVAICYMYMCGCVSHITARCNARRVISDGFWLPRAGGGASMGNSRKWRAVPCGKRTIWSGAVEQGRCAGQVAAHFPGGGRRYLGLRHPVFLVGVTSRCGAGNHLHSQYLLAQGARQCMCAGTRDKRSIHSCSWRAAFAAHVFAVSCVRCQATVWADGRGDVAWRTACCAYQTAQGGLHFQTPLCRQVIPFANVCVPSPTAHSANLHIFSPHATRHRTRASLLQKIPTEIGFFVRSDLATCDANKYVCFFSFAIFVWCVHSIYIFVYVCVHVCMRTLCELRDTKH